MSYAPHGSRRLIFCRTSIYLRKNYSTSWSVFYTRKGIRNKEKGFVRFVKVYCTFWAPTLVGGRTSLFTAFSIFVQYVAHMRRTFYLRGEEKRKKRRRCQRLCMYCPSSAGSMPIKPLSSSAFPSIFYVCRVHWKSIHYCCCYSTTAARTARTLTRRALREPA